MNKALIHDMTLKARSLLARETSDLLEGIYGLGAGGQFESTNNLSAIEVLDEARETRQQLERFVADEVSAGLGRQEAIEKLIKEVAFTHLNRLVAFKMLEARGLIRETIN